MQARTTCAIKAAKRHGTLLDYIFARAISDQVGRKPGILAEYLRLLNNGRLHADSTQLAAVQALQLLQDSMMIRLNKQQTPAAQPVVDRNSSTHTHSAFAAQEMCLSSKVTNDSTVIGAPPAGTQPGSSTAIAEQAQDGAAGKLGSDRGRGRQPAVQGAYLWGPVGSGKTLLMDMFLKTLPAATAPSSTSSSPSSSSSSNSNSSSHSNSSSSSSIDSAQQQQGAEALHLRTARVHYHEFMLAVHEQLHQLQQSLPRIITPSRSGLPVYRYATPSEDPILVVARTAASGLDLLCLDELHVTDVADAMLLSRLFGEVLCCGCSIMFTSNRPARDLYKGGLSRKYFEPFIKLIDDRLLQLRVAGGTDYRLCQQQQQQGVSSHGAVDVGTSRTGLWYIGPDAQQQLQQQWNKLAQQLTLTPKAPSAAVVRETTGSFQPPVRPARIRLPFGRTLWLPQALYQCSSTADAAASAAAASAAAVTQAEAGSIAEQPNQQQELAAALFCFDQLCGNQGSRQTLEHAGALSANDFLALVRSCPTIFIQGLPQLTPKLRDEARRLVTLIDLVYEVHTAKPGSVKLVVSGEAAPDELFLPLLGSAAAQGVNPNLGKSSSRLDVKQLVQEYGGHSRPPSNGADSVGAAAGEVGGPPQHYPQHRHKISPVTCATRSSSKESSHQIQGPASALLPEEVLMYHRASSRLVELCTVIGTVTAVE